MKPLSTTDSFGNKYWWLGDQLHREDGPACEYANGTKSWFYYGLRHREDGPAIEWSAGNKEWYINGNRIDCKDNQEFLRIIKLKMFL